MKHALRQSEEELRGKDLASRERIEELLVTVRQESATDSSRCVNNRPPQGSDTTTDAGRFRGGTSLDALFSLTDGRKGSNVENGGSIGLSSAVAAATERSREMFPLESAAVKGEFSGSRDYEEGERGEEEEAAGGAVVGQTSPQRKGQAFSKRERTPSTQGPTEKRRTSPVTETAEIQATTPKTKALAGTGSPVAPTQIPRPRVSRNKKPPAVISPALVELFRAPLLAARHLDPPIAGIAAAAVASGGRRRVQATAGAPITG